MDSADSALQRGHSRIWITLLRRAIRATKLDIEWPQILLYERLPNGEYRLNAVEFIIPYRLWARDSVAPIMMGQRFHHEDNLEIWYLHVWAWLNNPAGLFANFNSEVSCSALSRKVYTPSPPEG